MTLRLVLQVGPFPKRSTAMYSFWICQAAGLFFRFLCLKSKSRNIITTGTSLHLGQIQPKKCLPLQSRSVEKSVLARIYHWDSLLKPENFLCLIPKPVGLQRGKVVIAELVQFLGLPPGSVPLAARYSYVAHLWNRKERAKVALTYNRQVTVPYLNTASEVISCKLTFMLTIHTHMYIDKYRKPRRK